MDVGMRDMTYTRPQVVDYGTLLDLTADIDVNFTGALTHMALAAMSSPIGLGGETDVGGTEGRGVGGALGSGLGGGGGGGNLPFTGFPTFLVAMFGAALLSLGAAIRAGVRRRR